MLDEYLNKLIENKSSVPSRIFELSDCELSEKIINCLLPRCHLNDLKEMRAEFASRVNHLRHSSKYFDNLDSMPDNRYIKHNTHGAIILSMVGMYRFKFKPAINNSNLSFEYLLKNFANEQDNLAVFYYKVNNDNFKALMDFAGTVNFSKNKKLFAVAYGFLAYNKIK